MFSWFSDNWKTIASVAAAIVVGVAVTALIIATAPVSLPALLVTTAALAVGGFAGGVTGYLVNKWLNDEPVVVKDMLWEGTISAIVSVATLGLGRVLGPAVSRFVAPVAARVAPETAAPFVTRVVTNGFSFATAGATTGAGAQVANNALHERPLLENVDRAATTGFVLGGTFTVASEVAPLVFTRRIPVLETTTPETVPTKAPTEVSTVAPKQPGWGGVEPTSPILGNDRTILDQWNRFTNQFRKNGPLVLSDEQLSALEPGRMGPSNTLKTGDVKSLENFRTAAKKVNDLVKSGEDLSIDRIKELNETLLSDTSKKDWGGVVRTKPNEDVFHFKDGRPYFYASPEDVTQHLDDFMVWYKANESVLPPTELAGKSYQKLVRIHPFFDSNGRTTRLVMDWILQRNGLPPAVYTTADSQAVHAPTSYVVGNTAKASTTAQEILTTTSDTSAVTPTRIVVPVSPFTLTNVGEGTGLTETPGILGRVKNVQK